MDLSQKIDLLGESAKYDVCRGCGTESNRRRDERGLWIYPAVRPDGRRISLLKVLQSNICEKNCAYCVNRAGRDIPRTSFTPEELARSFDNLARRGLAEGLFLSSGVCGSVHHATDRMLATVDLVRNRYHFRGYIHLKILPGADDASIEASVRMAQRVSVNLEAPSSRRLRALAQGKDYARDLLAPLARADEIRRRINPRVSLTTQFVVGAADEPDQELLSAASWLYRQLRLARSYYSAFQPITNTPLENHPATPAWREHRLYQADFLLRDYGFGLQEMVFDATGNLPREADPKMVWARRHPERFPLEVNTASREDLLRIPGIGPVSADRILARRRQGTLRDLKHLGIPGQPPPGAPFILLGGRRPDYQMTLFDAEAAMVTG